MAGKPLECLANTVQSHWQHPPDAVCAREVYSESERVTVVCSTFFVNEFRIGNRKVRANCTDTYVVQQSRGQRSRRTP